MGGKGNEPVTKLELIEILDSRFNEELVKIATTIKTAVNGNLKQAKQEAEMKAMEREKEIVGMINDIRSDHDAAMNKMNLNIHKIATGVKRTMGHTKRLFEVTDELKDVKIPALIKHKDQQKGAMKLWGGMVGFLAAIGAAAGLIALLVKL